MLYQIIPKKRIQESLGCNKIFDAAALTRCIDGERAGNVGTMKQVYDVCVFGGGPAGTALAARLGDLGFAAIVLDRPPQGKAWRGESFTGAIRDPLNALGLWDEFRRAGHVAGYAQRTAWGGEPWIQDSIYHANGNRWHVDRARFDSDLREAVRKRGIAVRDYQSLEDLQREDRKWRITFDKGIEISSRYLVDATGRARVIARRLGSRPRNYDRLIALTALVPRNRNPEFDHTMVIESNAHGWWYAAPVPQGHVVAFLTDADLAPRGLARSMTTVAANSTYAQTTSGESWLPVGDACATHDPLCGWGVHRALTNGILAADAISQYLKTADTSFVAKYRRHCQSQFERYLVGLSRHYSYEQRWTSSPFWRRRCNSNVAT
jgi:flavin-dependent dehydrogenase